MTKSSRVSLLSWNLNHRGSRRRIAPWIAQAILQERATVVVLTEYIEGPDHEQFLAALRAGGLPHHRLSTRGAENGIVKENATQKELRGNQLLVLSPYPLSPGEIKAPDLAWLRPNTLHVKIDELGLDVLGVRIPSYEAGDKTRRKAWEWLLDAAHKLVRKPAIITGD